MGVMIGPMLMQPIVGWALDRRGTDLVAEGTRFYSTGAYHDGFVLMLIWLSVSTFLAFFTKETYCHQRSAQRTSATLNPALVAIHSDDERLR